MIGRVLVGQPTHRLTRPRDLAALARNSRLEWVSLEAELQFVGNHVEIQTLNS